MSAPVFLADPAALSGAVDPGDTVVLDGPEGRHAAVVRRLRAGEDLVLTDGRGTAVDAVVDSVVDESGRSGLVCRVHRRRFVDPPSPRLVVVQALPKGDRAELAIQMLTEVGVDMVVPWAASRCVVQWRGERAARSLAKWRSWAAEAGKQSRRVWLPEVRDVADTAAVAALLGSCALPVVLHENADRALPELAVPAEGDITVVVGPEGGITDDELAAFRDAGATAVRMGPSVLRTSTAGVAAGAALLSRTARWS
ncbi:MAG: 16S rRNA (uracil(1498)-N(3))-methyltransferase [Actinomycetota bacterium]|nr:16S rRNA (uracil(1498)-N(3))-methyltransferase [Actinomycetota bacterium]